VLRGRGGRARAGAAGRARLPGAASDRRLLAVGFLGTTLAYASFFEGAGRTTAIDAVLCLQTEPLYAMIGAWLFLGHRLTLRRIGALAILSLGIALAVVEDGRWDPRGIALLLVTPLFWQASHLVALRGLVGVPPSVLTGPPSIPLVAIAASFLLLGEVPMPRQWAGLVLVAAGVLAFVRAPHAVERSERIPTQTAPIAVPADPREGADQA